MEKTNNKSNVLIAVAVTILMTFMLGIMYFQNKTLDEYRELLEKTDTTTTITIDTLYLEKTIVDSVPKYINQTIFKTDTLYQKEGDSISATPLLITLKKKKQPILQ